MISYTDLSLTPSSHHTLQYNKIMMKHVDDLDLR